MSSNSTKNKQIGKDEQVEESIMEDQFMEDKVREMLKGLASLVALGERFSEMPDDTENIFEYTFESKGIRTKHRIEFERITVQ